MAHRFGDPTAKDAGRLTLNPLAHLDLVGTIMLFIVHFGWAKPVPVNPAYFANPRRDMIWVALAGPGANIALALFCGLALQALFGPSGALQAGTSIGVYLYAILSLSVFINLTLAFFNMLPLPPLDGSRVVEGLLPEKYLSGWFKIAKFGGYALFGLVIIGMITGTSVFKFILLPARWFYSLFTGGMPSMI